MSFFKKLLGGKSSKSKSSNSAHQPQQGAPAKSSLKPPKQPVNIRKEPSEDSESLLLSLPSELVVVIATHVRPQTRAAVHRMRLVSRQLYWQLEHLKDGTEPSLTDFTNLGPVGSGSSAQCFVVRHEGLQCVFCLKTYPYTLEETEIKRLVDPELFQVFSLIDTVPFVAKPYRAFPAKTRLCVIHEFIPGGELFWHLQRHTKFTEQVVRFWIAELVVAVSLLHQRGVLIRSLKPEDIVLDNEGHVYLTDFNLFKLLLNRRRTGSFVGTPEYLSPELVKGEEYSFPVDWWALGTLAYELLTGLPPFYNQDVNTMYRAIISDTPARFTNLGVSPECCDFMRRCLVKDAETRMTGEEAKQHPWLADIDWLAITNKAISPPFKPADEAGTGILKKWHLEALSKEKWEDGMAPVPEKYQDWYWASEYSPL